MFTVQIQLVDDHGPESDSGLVLMLPEKHPTRALAEKAAGDALRLLGRAEGTATYRILDSWGTSW